jgi:hypothetical protein
MIKKIVILFLLLYVPVIFGQSKVGTTAAEFLTIPAGAKATAMGGAFVAVSDDITAAYYNPGSLSRISGNEFIANYSDWLIDSRYNWIGIGIKAGEDDYVAISVYNLDYGEEEVTTVDSPEGTGEMWEASDIAINLSYCRNLTDRFSIGGTIKYIQQKIWNESASAFAADIGLLYKTEVEGLNIGMSISNFGQEMQLDGKDLLLPADVDGSYDYNNSAITSKLSTDTWELPLIFVVGLSWKYNFFNDFNLTAASDAVIPNNQNTYLNAGLELQWNNTLFIRTGRNSLMKNNAEEGFSFGAGIKYEIAGLRIGAEYAFLDFGAWSNLNRYSVSIGF